MDVELGVSRTEKVTVEAGAVRKAQQTMRRLEWSEARYGAQPYPDARSTRVPCCPECYGIKPLEDESMLARLFPPAAIGHREDCGLAATIAALDVPLLAE